MTGTGSLDVDVLIVGAGLSGIGAACRLTELCPDRSYAVLEAREASGGTWDVFRFPGVRSDSDVYTLAYPFRPWTEPDVLASGQRILGYIRDTAREFGVDDHIRHGQRVVSAQWSSDSARWSVRAETAEGAVQHSAAFLYVCTGYFSQATGHVVDFPGRDAFEGPVIHPQSWPEDFEATGKRIVVIGSGATAVTLVPALVDDGAAHVTMLQRSPSYVLSRSATDPVGRALLRALPARLADRALRMKYVLTNVGLYEVSRRFPRLVRHGIARYNARIVGGDTVRAHFTPAYEPWDQRMCIVPDADLFRAIGSGAVSVVTDTVERFTPSGIRLGSGAELAADAIVTATGLRVEVAGGMAFAMDGRPFTPADRWFYKGAMFGDVPNLAVCLGYTNNAWTLRADLTSRFVCAVLNRMAAVGAATATPRPAGPMEAGPPPFTLTSGYVQRALHLLPKQGTTAPWTVRQNYFHDRRLMSPRRVDDGTLELAAMPQRPGDGLGADTAAS